MGKKLDRFIIYEYIMFATLLLYLVNNYFVFLVIETILLGIMFIILKFDIKHPLTLFLLIFVLYQIAFPIINYNGIIIYESATINPNYYLYNWIATITLILSWGKLDKIEYKKEKIFTDVNRNILMPIFIIAVVLIIISNIFILTNKFIDKFALLGANSFIISIGRMLYVLISPIMLYFLLDKNLTNKRKKLIAFIVFSLVLIGSVIYKERDFLFNYIIIMLMYYFTVSKISIKKIGILGIICIVIFSISPKIKTLTNSNKSGEAKNEYNIILSFFNSDFAAAGFNFNYLLHNFNNYKNGTTYIFDFLSPIDMFIPSVEEYSVTKWYQSTYWSTRKTGLGFSIIGEGYANFGLLGIIIQMIILSRIVKFIYKKSGLNIYYYVIYLTVLPLCMYSCRGSLASIISQAIKYHILLAIFVYVISRKKEKVKGEQIIK